MAGTHSRFTGQDVSYANRPWMASKTFGPHGNALALQGIGGLARSLRNGGTATLGRGYAAAKRNKGCSTPGAASYAMASQRPPEELPNGSKTLTPAIASAWMHLFPARAPTPTSRCLLTP